LVLEDPAGARAYAHLKAGSIRGLSIGFSVPEGKASCSNSNEGTRTLREVRLHEISLVAIPANPQVQVFSVKSLSDVQSLLRGLRDVDDDALGNLLEIDHELKRLLVDRDPAKMKMQLLAKLGSFAEELKSLAA
jgi:hypothetical protein